MALSRISANSIQDGTVIASELGSMTSAELAGKITDETGSGGLVFANSPVITSATVQSTFERANIVAAGCPTVFDFAINDNTVIFYTGDSTGNVSINFVGNATTTLNDTLTATSNTVTAVLAMTNGATPYYVNNVQIDGTVIHDATITGNLYWQGNTLTVGGTDSGIDVYSFTILKTGANAYKVLAGQSNFNSSLV